MKKRAMTAQPELLKICAELNRLGLSVVAMDVKRPAYYRGTIGERRHARASQPHRPFLAGPSATTFLQAESWLVCFADVFVGERVRAAWRATRKIP